MPKTDGELTKERILQVAEKLFSENGFDGTGVDKIAKSAGINKGSIYYHFKDKNAIIEELFQNIISEMRGQVRLSACKEDSKEEYLKEKIKSEIKYLDSKSKILAILLMETLKSESNIDYFIQCMEVVIKKELNSRHIDREEMSEEELHKHLVHEFFTGYMPVISLITLKEKWCNYFDIEEDKLMELFMESFAQTHLKSHK